MTIQSEIERYLQKKKVEFEIGPQTLFLDIPLYHKQQLILLQYLEETFVLGLKCPLKLEQVQGLTISDLTSKAKRKHGTN